MALAIFELPESIFRSIVWRGARDVPFTDYDNALISSRS